MSPDPELYSPIRPTIDPPAWLVTEVAKVPLPLERMATCWAPVDEIVPELVTLRPLFAEIAPSWLPT